MMPARAPHTRTSSIEKEATMSLTRFIAVAIALSMFAVAAEARPARHHHKHHHHHHHKHHRHH